MINLPINLPVIHLLAVAPLPGDWLIFTCLIFGLLLYLINYCADRSHNSAPDPGLTRVILAALIALLLIGTILDLAGISVFVR